MFAETETVAAAAMATAAETDQNNKSPGYTGDLINWPTYSAEMWPNSIHHCQYI